MRKLLLIPALALLMGCTKEGTTCTQKVYRRKMGEPFKLVLKSSWEGPAQYKNYTFTHREADGSLTVIKTVVTCQ